jgi:hypothetical protein
MPRWWLFCSAFLVTALSLSAPSYAQAPPPITDAVTINGPICPPIHPVAKDAPDDTGDAVAVSWKPCAKSGVPVAETYAIFRSEKNASGTSPMVKVAQFGAGENLTEEKNEKGVAEKTYVYYDQGLSETSSYIYRVAALAGDSFAYGFTLNDDNEAVADLGPVSPTRDIIPYAERDKFHGLPVSPPVNITARDRPNDAGDGIIVSWTPSADMPKTPGVCYRVYRSAEPEGNYTFLGTAGADATEFEDAFLPEDKPHADYYYVVAVSADEGMKLVVSDRSNAVRALSQWIDWNAWNYFLFAVILSAFIAYFIQHIKSGKKLFIRKISGLEAVDESIGRATEMGKPVLFIPGIQDMNDVQTVAAMSILGRVAKTIAEYDAHLLCPTCRSLVMTTGRETVKEAFISAGRPDAYNDDIVTYLTDEQFGYVAGVNGTMMRDRPATILYFGSFFAESLIMAETGNHIGAIQIAGTAQPSQLPFFVAACDYTLLGEELFAAAAYLSHDPKQLGSLKGQDVGKFLGMMGIVLGSIFVTIVELTHAGWALSVANFIRGLFTATAG